MVDTTGRERCRQISLSPIQYQRRWWKVGQRLRLKAFAVQSEFAATAADFDATHRFFTGTGSRSGRFTRSRSLNGELLNWDQARKDAELQRYQHDVGPVEWQTQISV